MQTIGTARVFFSGFNLRK